MNEGRKRWIGGVPHVDDFGVRIKDEFIDGMTKMGPWATMAPESWATHGVGVLGTGRGQRYVREGTIFYKVEG